jgi:low affinity Fe/Cu permease
MVYYGDEEQRKASLVSTKVLLARVQRDRDALHRAGVSVRTIDEKIAELIRDIREAEDAIGIGHTPPPSH